MTSARTTKLPEFHRQPSSMNARARFVGFLHESLDPAHMGIERQRRAGVNVVVAGGGMVGRDGEGDDFARLAAA